MKTIKNMKKPCKECPYLKTSAKGYLGESSGNPQEFLYQLESPEVHPCHLTVDWEEEDYSKATTCVGALQFMNNSCKKSKFPAIAKEQAEAGKNEDVLAFNHNFINHHSI